MTKIIAITNQKGGVGKTTTALNLGTQLAFSGRRVLVVDLDPQGQCAIGLGLNPEPGTFNLLVNSSFEPRQWIRPSGRKGLDLIPGDRSTATAQIVINAENRPLEYIRDLLRRSANINISSSIPHHLWAAFRNAPSSPLTMC